MIVKVKRCEVHEKYNEKTGEDSVYTSAIVIFGDKMTAAKLFIPSDVCDPSDIEEGGLYDLYRDEKGYCLVFDKVEKNDSRS